MNSTISYPCLPIFTTNFAIVLLVVLSPLHTFILITLYRCIFEKFPRHKFLISLSISDNLLITLAGLFAIISRIFHLRTTSTSCQVLRKLVEFSGCMAIVGSSTSIVALSVERYISCVYCLRAHAILTNKRIKIALFTVWTLAIACGFSVLHPSTPNPYPTLMNSVWHRVLYSATVILSSIVMLVIQVCLYRISRRKLMVEPHGTQFGVRKEAAILRRRHLKLAFVASVVVVLYVVCMAPLALLVVYELISGVDDSVFVAKPIVSLLALANTLVDPFVYCLGMRDTRKILFKEVNRIRLRFFEFLQVDQ